MRFPLEIRINTWGKNRVIITTTGYKASIPKNRDIFHSSWKSYIDFLPRIKNELERIDIPYTIKEGRRG